MPDIFHQFPIKAPTSEVFKAISSPNGLDSWWSLKCAGISALNEIYILDFGPEYVWQAKVSCYVPNQHFELTFTAADIDWTGSKMGFILKEKEGVTMVDFYHTKWPELNNHYKISCFCWAMYLRLLKKYIETGNIVPYDDRLEA